MAKTRAKRNVNNRAKKGTLDQKHTEKLTKFEKMAESLPKKREKLIRLTKELNTLKSMNPNKYSHEDIRRKAYIMDTIEKLKNDIHSIENCTEPLNYIANTLPILVNYYDNENIIDDDKEEFITEASTDGKKYIKLFST